MKTRPQITPIRLLTATGRQVTQAPGSLIPSATNFDPTTGSTTFPHQSGKHSCLLSTASLRSGFQIGNRETKPNQETRKTDRSFMQTSTAHGAQESRRLP